MAKPAGPACNLNCTYCFYLEKESLFSQDNSTFMSDEILEAYTEKYILSQEGREINFAWQGGEPTIAGLDFFRKALKLQKKYNKGKKITNAIQTNGILINDEWCRFFAKHNFLVGLSLDGPKGLHNIYRKNKNGGPTFDKVKKAQTMFKQHGVEYNILTSVNAENSRAPLDVYNFLVEAGVEFIQFIPIVERDADENSIALGLSLSSPEADSNYQFSMTDWSVDPEDYGDFLIAIFDQWVRHDIGKVFVMNFEWALSSAINGSSGVCHFAPQCGNAGILEHNGDLYSCDHFVYPQYKIGNILSDDPKAAFNSEKQLQFGKNKQETLSDECLKCPVLSMCYGGCPKHRFEVPLNGELAQNYLCRGYKKFFKHLIPYVEISKTLIRDRKPLTELMKLVDTIN